MKPNIRPAIESDVQSIFNFIMDLAIYEKAENEVIATPKDIKRSLFNQEIPTECLIAEVDGKAVGFAVFFYSYSTWLGKHGIYLEDLYIDINYRGKGYGKALVKEIAKTAYEKGCERLEWSCLDWNKPSLDFYNSIGANQMKEWVKLRLSGEELKEFANS